MGQYPVDVSQPESADIDATGQTMDMGSIIRKCWTPEYERADEILKDLDGLDRISGGDA